MFIISKFKPEPSDIQQQIMSEYGIQDDNPEKDMHAFLSQFFIKIDDEMITFLNDEKFKNVLKNNKKIYCNITGVNENYVLVYNIIRLFYDSYLHDDGNFDRLFTQVNNRLFSNIIISIYTKLLCIKLNKNKYNEANISQYYNELIKNENNIYSYLKIRSDGTANERFLFSPLEDNVNKYLKLGYSVEDLKIEKKEQLTKEDVRFYYFGKYDKIYYDDNSNEEIANTMFDKIKNNDNITIIPFGQSGSGKTTVLLYKDIDSVTEKGVLFYTLDKLAQDYNILEINLFQIYINFIRQKYDNPESVGYLIDSFNGVIKATYNYDIFKQQNPDGNFLEEIFKNSKMIFVKKDSSKNEWKLQGIDDVPFTSTYDVDFEKFEQDTTLSVLKTKYPKVDYIKYEHINKIDDTTYKNKLDPTNLIISSDEILKFFMKNYRYTKPTPLNKESSRSHILLTIKLCNAPDTTVKAGIKPKKITFFDLAGIEPEFACTDPLTLQNLNPKYLENENENIKSVYHIDYERIKQYEQFYTTVPKDEIYQKYSDVYEGQQNGFKHCKKVIEIEKGLSAISNETDKYKLVIYVYCIFMLCIFKIINTNYQSKINTYGYPEITKYLIKNSNIKTLYYLFFDTKINKFYDNEPVSTTFSNRLLADKNLNQKIKILINNLIDYTTNYEKIFKILLGEDSYGIYKAQIDSVSLILTTPDQTELFPHLGHTYTTMKSFDIIIQQTLQTDLRIIFQNILKNIYKMTDSDSNKIADIFTFTNGSKESSLYDNFFTKKNKIYDIYEDLCTISGIAPEKVIKPPGNINIEEILSSNDDTKQHNENVLCYNNRINLLKINCKNRVDEGKLINESLKYLIKSLQNINLKGKEEYLYFGYETYSKCKNTNLNSTRYYNVDDTEKNGIGILYNLIAKFNDNADMKFILLTVINLSNETNNPPSIPYINELQELLLLFDILEDKKTKIEKIPKLMELFYIIEQLVFDLYNKINTKINKTIREDDKEILAFPQYEIFSSSLNNLFQTYIIDPSTESTVSITIRYDALREFLDSIYLITRNSLIGTLEDTDHVVNIYKNRCVGTHDKITDSHNLYDKYLKNFYNIGYNIKGKIFDEEYTENENKLTAKTVSNYFSTMPKYLGPVTRNETQEEDIFKLSIDYTRFKPEPPIPVAAVAPVAPVVPAVKYGIDSVTAVSLRVKIKNMVIKIFDILKLDKDKDKDKVEYDRVQSFSSEISNIYTDVIHEKLQTNHDQTYFYSNVIIPMLKHNINPHMISTTTLYEKYENTHKRILNRYDKNKTEFFNSLKTGFINKCLTPIS